MKSSWRRHILFALVTSIVSAAIAPPALASNDVPPKAVAQSAAKASEIATTLKKIKLPPGFRIALFATVPDARDMAVAPDGRRVFVGTLGDQAYVLDVAKGPRVAAVKTFAPSIAKIMAHGVCFAPDGTLYLAEQNRILAFPQAEANAERPDLKARIVVAQNHLIPPGFASRGHSARVCRVGPDGALYVAIGQPANVPAPDQWKAFSKDGLGAIVRMKTDGSGREIFATATRSVSTSIPGTGPFGSRTIRST